MKQKNLKVAIVYDWVDKWGGVERLLLILHEQFPQSPLYTSYVDSTSAPWAWQFNIIPSFIQRFPGWIRKNRLFSFIFYPFVFETFDFSSYDLVITVTSSFAKSAISKPPTKHLCILLTPTRYLWLYPLDYMHVLVKKVFGFFFNSLKKWDRVVSRRPDVILSISREVAKRCNEHYGLPSGVLYPPFDEVYWSKTEKENKEPLQIPFNSDYFLIVSRLEPYKKTEIVIDAFNRFPKKKLIIVGRGTRGAELKNKTNGGNIFFIDEVDDRGLAWLYMHALALIMPQQEDFGYTAIEAQFFGCPVLAFQKGGVKETVIENETGLFFSEQTGTGVQEVLERFDKISYNLKRTTKLSGKKQVDLFSKEKFLKQLNAVITSL